MIAFKNKRQSGFTLVELLVVIVILAILGVVALTVFTAAGKRARTSKRISDLKEIQQQLERYKIENGSYPSTGLGWQSECYIQPPNNVMPGMVPNYLHSMPADPSMYNDNDPDPTDDHSCYWYISDGTDYKFEAWDIREYTQADYRAYPQFIDPAFDGGPNPSNEYDPSSCNGTSGTSPGQDGSFIESWSIQTHKFRCVQ